MIHPCTRRLAVNKLSACLAVALLATFVVGCGSDGAGDVQSLKATPGSVDFGMVTIGEQSGVEVELRNISTSDKLVLTDIATDKLGAEFTVTLPAVTVLNPGETASFTLTYAPSNMTADEGFAVISYASAGLNHVLKIPVAAEPRGADVPNVPTMSVSPDPVVFGGKVVGSTGAVSLQIRSLGAQPLEVSGIELDGASSPEFSLDLSTLEAVPTSSSPVSLAYGESIEVNVVYSPADQTSVDDDGKPIPDTGIIHITTNASDAPLDVAVSGFGVMTDCPMPVIVGEEGDEVPPLTTLHLHGDQSQTGVPGASIVSWSWTVSGPEGNNFSLQPSANDSVVTHEVNVSGEYTYCLDVCDGYQCSNDERCRTTACKLVKVLPSTAIHCELTWDTPGDLNQYDEGNEKGSDMDLHFAHPMASVTPDQDGDGDPDPWFDTLYDCYWLNPHPEWETDDVLDNPSIDRDDLDGAGPENLTLMKPVTGRVYRIGVNYFNDHGFGGSYARVKCYLNSELRFAFDTRDVGEMLYSGDMWYVATLSWPQGEITLLKDADESLKITHNYVTPATL